MIGKTLINLGSWFNKHFPEKVSTDEVYGKLAAIELRLHDVASLETHVNELRHQLQGMSADVLVLAKKVEALTSENTALKAAAALRVRASIPMPGR